MWADDAFALRLLEDFRAIDPAAIVRDADRDAGTLAHRRQDDLTFRVLLVALALGGGLDAVIDRVAQQMHEGIAERVEDFAIELDFFPLDPKGHLLVELPRDVAHQAREAVEDLPHRRHPRQDDFVLQIGGKARDLDRDLVDLRILSHPARGDVVQPAALGHELADQIHERVEPPQVDADVAGASPPRTFGGTDLALIRAAAERHALDVAHRSDGGLDVGGRTGGL